VAKLSAPLAAFGIATIKIGADFNAGMSEVKAITGATGKDFDRLKESAKDLGSKTAYSAKEASEGMKYLGMAGFKTNDIISAMPGLLDLAAASGTDLGTTSDIVSDALTAFGLKAEDTGHFADILATASSNANTNVEMLGESFKYVAPVAGSMGVSAKDTAFGLSLMANSGIKASAGGTALRSSLINLAKPSKDMKKTMDQLGISLTDSNGKVKSGKALFDDLRVKMGGLSKAQQSSAAATIFGKEAMSGMLAIVNASSEDYDKLYGKLSNADGAAKKMADTMQDNLKGSITKLKSALEGLIISLSDVLIPVAKTVVEKVQVITDGFSSLVGPNRMFTA